MRTVGGFCIALVLVPAVFAQHPGGFASPQPFLRGGEGSVLYPGGTFSTMPNITRTIPNVVHPGGGGVRLIVPGAVADPTFAQRLAATTQGRNFRRFPPNGFNNFRNYGRVRGTSVVAVPYAVPVYVGGYGGYGYDYGYDAGAYMPAPDAVPPDQPPVQQTPNVIVIYPPAQQPAVPNAQMAAPPPETQPSVTSQPAEEAQPTIEPSHYLIALKDHTIYAAVAYWVDGDTLHYFTNGNTHNQVSLSLVDRPLTDRLNRESGIDFRLPPAPAVQ